MTDIIAREAEIERLEHVLKTQTAVFFVVYGRRRVGKTYLISEYFKDKGIYFEIMGTKNSTKQEQLKKFQREFQRTFPLLTYETAPSDWEEALHRLHEMTKNITSQKIILFFDELPWLASPRSGLLKELDYYWNRHFSRQNNLILIVCGSVSSWIIKKIIRNTAGFHGRISDKMCLQPFKLNQVETFLQHNNVRLAKKQIIELFMAIGGIAKYLTFIKAGESAIQLINGLFFKPQAPLITEFYDLYHSLFNNAERHIRIIKLLAKHRFGLTRNELIQKLKISSGGYLTSILDDLEESGFILSIPQFNLPDSEKTYRLIDEFSYFYLSWVDENRMKIIHGVEIDYWQKQTATRQWPIWSGFAFENICFRHVINIKRALGIIGINTQLFHWAYRGDEETGGVEIDLIIDRADQCINLCEIKFYNTEFVVTKHYSQVLERKKQTFMQKTKTKKTVFITLITPFGVKDNEHYRSIVDNQLTIEDLF